MLESDRRHATRVEFREPVQYRFLDSEEMHGSLGYDLSESGVRFQTEDFIPLRKKLALHLELDPGQALDLNGQVVWVQLVPHSERYHVGLNFENSDTTKNSQKVIQEFISSHRI